MGVMGWYLNSINKNTRLADMASDSLFDDLTQEIAQFFRENPENYEQHPNYQKIQYILADEFSLQPAFLELLLMRGNLPDILYRELLFKYIPLIITNKTHLEVIKATVDILTFRQNAFVDADKVKNFVEVLIQSTNAAGASMIEAILDYALQQGNGMIIQYLQNNYSEDLSLIENGWKENKDSRSHLLDKYLAFVQKQDPTYSSNVLYEFSNNVSSIKHQGGLLTLAQIHDRKVKEQYDFDPTLIKDTEISDYLNIIREMPGAFADHFIISGIHWTCGVVQKDEDGRVSFLVVDPLGVDKNGDLFTETQDMLLMIASIFENKTYQIYFDAVRRQNDEKSCAVYAIDDLQHLYALEQNWQRQNFNLTLFEFLEKNKQREKSIETVKINLTPLPLTLMRTMQSRRLRELIIPRRAKKEPPLVNKKGETAQQSVSKTFLFNPQKKKDENQRAKFNYHKMRQYNEQYLLTTDPQHIHQTTMLFTLSEVKAKIEKKLKSSAKPQRPQGV
jgi:hypothetical protein